MNRRLALRALKDLCAFIGAIALISYFGNFFVDLRHWYVTLVSAFVCLTLWLGFYVIERRGGITQVASGLSRLRMKPVESPSPAEPATPPAEASALPAESTSSAVDVSVLPAAQAADSVPAEVETPPPNPLPWLKPNPALKKAAGKT